jgi:hypothetical protein
MSTKASASLALIAVALILASIFFLPPPYARMAFWAGFVVIVIRLILRLRQIRDPGSDIPEKTERP